MRPRQTSRPSANSGPAQSNDMLTAKWPGQAQPRQAPGPCNRKVSGCRCKHSSSGAPVWLTMQRRQPNDTSIGGRCPTVDASRHASPMERLHARRQPPQSNPGRTTKTHPDNQDTRDARLALCPPDCAPGPPSLCLLLLCRQALLPVCFRCDIASASRGAHPDWPPDLASRTALSSAFRASRNCRRLRAWRFFAAAGCAPPVQRRP